MSGQGMNGQIAIPGARIVRPITRDLLLGAIASEGDPLTAEMAREPGYAERFLSPISGALIGRGRVLAAAGLMPLWHGRALAWLMLGEELTPRQRVLVVRYVRGVMEECQREPAFRRVEMHVRANEPWARRFGRCLGFACEGLMRVFDERGRDYLLFARVAEGRR